MQHSLNFTNSTSIRASLGKKSLLVQHTIALQTNRLKSSKKGQFTLFKDDIDHIPENVCPICTARPFFGKCYNCSHTTAPTLF